MNQVQLKLFVTGQTRRSDVGIANLQHILDNDLGIEYELAIVDILEQPQLAEDERILATPTLIKVSPAPACRIIGDFSDRKQVLGVLGVHSSPATDTIHGGTT
jgi:circadian clock protein KaiB